MLKETIETLEKNKIFLDYKEKNKSAYLAHVFFLLDEANKDIIQIGYFNRETEKITTFIFDKSSISKNPEADVFKEQEGIIKKVEISKVGIELDDAIRVADELFDKKYLAEKTIKKIAILQHLPIGQVWNITYILGSFRTLNIKIDSTSGKILDEKISSMFSVK